MFGNKVSFRFFPNRLQETEMDANIRSIFAEGASVWRPQAHYPSFRALEIGKFKTLGAIRSKNSHIYLAQAGDTKHLIKVEITGESHLGAFLKQEQGILVELNHDRIPKVVGKLGTARFDDNSEHLCFAQSYIEGLSLQHLMEELLKSAQRLKFSSYLDIFIQVAKILDYCHRQGIVHRDVKPSNIVLSLTDQSVQAFLIDFGFARRISETGADCNIDESLICGTPGFTYPFQGLALNSVYKDIYGVAACIFYCLTKKYDLPYYQTWDDHRKTVDELGISNKMPVLLSPVNWQISNAQWRSDIPAVLPEVLLKGLSTEQSMRFATMADFIKALENLH